MKGVGAGVKVGLTALAILAIGYFSFKFVSKGIKGQEGYEVWALFKDAGGLVDKSRVQVAGLIVGEIRGRRLAAEDDKRDDQGALLEGSYARVDLRVKPGVPLWSNAAIYKKSASLLGEFYLEIDPGTPETPDPVTGKVVKHYLLQNCEAEGHGKRCMRIGTVVEAVTVTDVMTQISETVPVLRDILKDVQKLTQGPLHDIAKEVQAGVARNSEAAERLLNHIDQIAGDVKELTGGSASDDVKRSVANIRDITESVKKILGSGEGQMNSTADKLKQNLDKLADALDKASISLENVRDLTTHVQQGRGTVGRLLKDETIADNITDVVEDATGFVRSITKLQTLVGLREEYNFMSNSWKTYVQLRLMPRPDKYYLIELVDDPRGSGNYSHTFTSTGDPNNPSITNTDTYTRTRNFRFSFMFAKRIEFRNALGITGRVGIKESTGGLGLDLDLWKQRVQLQVDVFDFMAAKYPRIKVLAAIEFFKHLWLVGGIDDIINQSGTDSKPVGANGQGLSTCGPASPNSWCTVGRDYFVGLMLTFNDEDLKSLLTIGGSALGGLGR